MRMHKKTGQTAVILSCMMLSAGAVERKWTGASSSTFSSGANGEGDTPPKYMIMEDIADIYPLIFQ